MMDNDICNVIYVDRNVCESRLVSLPATDLQETGDLRANLDVLLDAFGHGEPKLTIPFNNLLANAPCSSSSVSKRRRVHGETCRSTQRLSG